VSSFLFFQTKVSQSVAIVGIFTVVVCHYHRVFLVNNLEQSKLMKACCRGYGDAVGFFIGWCGSYYV